MTQIEPSAIRPVIENDRTAVFIDIRDATEFKTGSIPGAKNLPRSLVKEGKTLERLRQQRKTVVYQWKVTTHASSSLGSQKRRPAL